MTFFSCIDASVQVGNKDLAQHRLKGIFAHKGDLFTTSFAVFAARFPEITDVRVIARKRAEAMYRAYAELKDPPYGTAAAVSYAIDLHVPLILGTVTQLHIAYRLKKTPEFQQNFPVTLSDSLGIASELWALDGPYTNLRRLLRKGGPFASSVRYVSSQMQRCLSDKKSSKTIGCLLRMTMLGAYCHCTTIADVETRLKVYKSPDSNLINVFEALQPRSSHDFFFATAEFVLACSKLMPSLWTWVLQNKNYQTFDKTVVRATDIMRRGLKPPRVVQIVAPRAWSARASLHGLVAASATRKKLNASALQHDHKELARVYKKSVLSTRRRGYAYSAAEVLGKDVEGIQDCLTDANQRTFCNALPPLAKAKLQAYCHGQLTQKALSVGTLSENVSAAQRHAVAKRTGFTHSYAFVCLCCGTWRPKAASFNRGTVGVQITTRHNAEWTYRCNLCKNAWGIRKVDMVGKLLKARFKIDGPSQLITICAECGSPTTNPTFTRTLPRCSTCTRDRTISSCFHCGKENKGDFFKFAARQRGSPQIFFACQKHVPQLAGLEHVPIDMLRVKQSPSVYSKNGTKRKRY